MKGLFSLLVCFCLAGCSWQPGDPRYHEFYSYYSDRPCSKQQMQESDYFLVILVTARHLNYYDNKSLLKTMAKHPSDGSKNGDVGHVWVYVEGWRDGEKICIEGGQSGDTGAIRPTYMEGVMERVCDGHPDPVSYLWETFPDGFFQRGSGGHVPTYAAKVNLTQQQFESIMEYIIHHDYSYYSLCNNQCAKYTTHIATLADWHLEHRLTIALDEHVYIGKEKIPLRSCEDYAFFTLSSPDMVERSLVESVRRGEAEDALQWYLKNKKKCFRCGINKAFNDMSKMPSRIARCVFFFY